MGESRARFAAQVGGPARGGPGREGEGGRGGGSAGRWGPLQQGRSRRAGVDTGENERYHVRGDARLEGVAEHALFDAALFQTQGFLTGFLFLLSPPIFLGAGLPVVLRSVIVGRSRGRGRGRDSGAVLGGRSHGVGGVGRR